MPDVQLTSVMPVLRVDYLARSRVFYTDVLGFTVAWTAKGDGDSEECMLQGGEVAVLLSTGAHLGGTPRFTGTLYFSMSGVAEFYQSIKARVNVAWPLSRMEYGTLEFGIHDPDGYMLGFAEEQ